MPQHEVDDRRLGSVDRHRLRLRFPLGVPHGDRVGARWHVLNLVQSVLARRRKKRILQYHDVAFHLWMDPTELHVHARRLDALGECMILRLALWPRAKVVLLTVW